MKTQLDVLIVEDEALIAMDLAGIIEDCGHTVMAEANSLRAVEALPAERTPDLAFVDLQLADNSTGLQVCEYILTQWRDTLIIFVTANPSRLPVDMGGGHGVIAKPFSRNGLGSALRYLSDLILDPPPKMQKPESVELAPSMARSRG